MSDIKFEYSDPRGDEYKNDPALDSVDCVPRAISLMTKVSYSLAIADMEQLARDIVFPITDKPYMYKKIYEIYLSRRGIYPSDCYMTLQEFCSNNSYKDKQLLVYISSLSHLGFYDKGTFKDIVNNYKPDQLVTCIYERII